MGTQLNNPIIIRIPLKGDEGEFIVYQSDLDEWQEAFKKINVLSVLKVLRQWNISHVNQRKTRVGIRKHITGWLTREQEKKTSVPSTKLNVLNSNIRSGSKEIQPDFQRCLDGIKELMIENFGEEAYQEWLESRQLVDQVQE